MTPRWTSLPQPASRPWEALTGPLAQSQHNASSWHRPVGAQGSGWLHGSPQLEAGDDGGRAPTLLRVGLTGHFTLVEGFYVQTLLFSTL